MTVKTFKYSEIFHSFQGEGKMTGAPTAWIRFTLCNLTCSGFGQSDPTDPSTYVLPYQTFDVSSIKRIEDLPVWDYGCDSSYTWAKKYLHLAADEPATVICDQIQDCFKHESNPNGLFLHPITKQWTHMAFTGGEPMLNQAAMVAILREFNSRNNLPAYVTIETNGTRPFKPKEELAQVITEEYAPLFPTDDIMMFPDPTKARGPREWFWSCSPKLFSTSGEKPKKAIRPDVVGSYAALGTPGQLKYVVNGTPESWKEVEDHTKAFRAEGVDWPVYIMPVGATLEEQSGNQIADIAVEAMKRGYAFSGRLHCYVFGNQIGT